MDEPQPLAPTEGDSSAQAKRAAALRKLALLGGLAVGLIVLAQFTPLGAWLSEESLLQVLAWFGKWAAPVYVVLFALLLALWVPGTVITFLGAALFGKVWAMPLNYLGAVLGAWLGFAMARGIGGDALRVVVGDRWKLARKYRHWMENRGFEAVLYARVIPTPFNLISYIAGLSGVRSRAFVLATAIGILPGSLTLTYLIGNVIEAYRAKDIMLLITPAMGVAIALYVVTLSIPYWLSVGRRKYGWFAGADDVRDAAT